MTCRYAEQICNLGRRIAATLAVAFGLAAAPGLAGATIINPDPANFGADSGTELFTPGALTIGVKLFDLFTGVPTNAVFGFYHHGAPFDDANTGVLFTSFDPVPSARAIDFSLGVVSDYPTPGLIDTFTPGLFEIGFYLAFLEDAQPPAVIFSDAALNPGGLDLVATFPSLTTPGAYLIGFEVPTDNGFVTVALDLIGPLTPVSEPATGATFLLALAGMVGLLTRQAARGRTGGLARE